jgi:hypothetical protein
MLFVGGSCEGGGRAVVGAPAGPGWLAHLPQTSRLLPRCPPPHAHTPGCFGGRADSPFFQQRLKAWQPILTPKWVIISFCLVALVFIPVGIVLVAASNSVRAHPVLPPLVFLAAAVAVIAAVAAVASGAVAAAVVAAVAEVAAVAAAACTIHRRVACARVTGISAPRVAPRAAACTSQVTHTPPPVHPVRAPHRW